MKTNREKETEKSSSNNATPFKDCPITNSNEDKLNTSKYVNGLTEFIKICETPMTISIQGEWGSGKTSFMNMIKEKLLKDNFSEDNLIFVNVWKYAQFCDGKNIARAVLSGVLSELKTGNKAKDVLKKVFRALGTVAEIAVDSTVGDKASEMVENITNSVTAEPTIENLQEAIKTSIDEHLKNSGNQRIVFFVDDLDRLKPIQAIEVLEIIKNYLDIEKCVFVLAIDYDVIIDGVKEKYGNDFSTKKAHQFFEKIIQVPFKLPKQGYEITDYLKIFSSSENVNENIKLILETSVGKNPRAIKRAMNILNLTKLINANENEDDKILVIICLQLCYNEIYDEMLKNPGEWQEAFNIKTENVVDERFIENFIKLFKNDKNNEKIEELLELTKVTDFETGKIKKETYYVKLNIENQDTKILHFIKGGQMKSGIPALNFLIINAYKNNMLNDWYRANVNKKTNIEKLKSEKLNKYWLFDIDEDGIGDTFNSKIYDIDILNELKKVLREELDGILCESRYEAKISEGINVASKTWTYFIER